MCQTLIVSYSCGCVKEQLSLPCENPRTVCTRLSKTFQKSTSDKPCKHHRNHTAFRAISYTRDQGRTNPSSSTIERSTSGREPESETRKLRRQPAFELSRPEAMPKRAAGPEQVRVPSTKGLDRLQEKLGALSLAATTAAPSTATGVHRDISIPKRSTSLRHQPTEIPNRFETPKLPKAIPLRKPVAPDIMSIPVYDNGTEASYKQAQRLRSLSGSSTNGSSQRAEILRSTSRSSRPPTSFPSSSSRRHSQSAWSADSSRPSSYTESEYDQNLYPAPLKINRSKTIQISKQLVEDSYRHRPLPQTPDQFFPPSSYRERSKHRVHDNLSPHLITSHHDEQEASQIRLANAKRAIDSGKWTSSKSCPEIEALTREEKRNINEYILRRRDNKRDPQHEVERWNRAADEVRRREKELRKRDKTRRCSVM